MEEGGICYNLKLKTTVTIFLTCCCSLYQTHSDCGDGDEVLITSNDHVACRLHNCRLQQQQSHSQEDKVHARWWSTSCCISDGFSTANVAPQTNCSSSESTIAAAAAAVRYYIVTDTICMLRKFLASSITTLVLAPLWRYYRLFLKIKDVT